MTKMPPWNDPAAYIFSGNGIRSSRSVGNITGISWVPTTGCDRHLSGATSIGIVVVLAILILSIHRDGSNGNGEDPVLLNVLRLLALNFVVEHDLAYLAVSGVLDGVNDTLRNGDLGGFLLSLHLARSFW